MSFLHPPTQSLIYSKNIAQPARGSCLFLPESLHQSAGRALSLSLSLLILLLVSQRNSCDKRAPRPGQQASSGLGHFIKMLAAVACTHPPSCLRCRLQTPRPLWPCQLGLNLQMTSWVLFSLFQGHPYNTAALGLAPPQLPGAPAGLPEDK